MKFQLISTKYRNSYNGPVVTVYGRDEQGKSVQHDISGFRPYFYILPNNTKNARQLLRERPEVTDVFEEYKYLPNGYQQERTEVLQVYVNKPSDVPVLRDALKGHKDIKEIYEADILYATARFLTDNDLYGMKWVEVSGNNIQPLHDIIENAPLRFLGVDIEVLPPEVGVPLSERDPITIISISFNDQKTLVLVAKPGQDAETIKYFPDEFWMLSTFMDIFKEYDPDVVMAFNGDNFDFPYIEKRLEVLGIANDLGRDGTPFQIRAFGASKEVNMTGRAYIDLLNAIKLNYSLASYSLDNVSKTLLNRPKLDIKASEMREIWLSGSESRLQRFLEYAGRDADLLQDIINELKLIDRYINISKDCGLLLHETINGGQSRRIESMLLREFYKEGRLWPLNDKDKKVEKVTGGKVLDSERGLHENLIIMDYKSLYPSAIRAYNICWSSIINEKETSVKTILAPNGVRYTDHTVYEGIMPRILTKLYNKRVELKKLMKSCSDKNEREFYDNQQYSVKILLNSFYGYTGALRGRLYDPRLANSVTSVGRMAIQLTKKTAEELVDCHVVGGDTDSVFIRLNKVTDPDESKKCAKIIHDSMLTKLPPPMEIDFECFAKRAIIFEKKRYAMWIFEQGKDGWKDKIKYRGIETRRRDWVSLVGESMDKVLHLILCEGKVEEAWKYTNEVILSVKGLMDIRTNLDLAEKLVLSRKIGNIEGYTNIQPHVTCYKKMKARNETLPGLGDRIRYMALPGASKDGISLMVDTPERIKETDGRIDNTFYIEHQLLPPLERVFSAIGIDITTGKKKLVEASLFGFESIAPKELNTKKEKVVIQKKPKMGLFSFS
jgi:DNA polymerase I